MPSNTFPLHPSQEDVYLDQAIDTESSHYNIGGYISINGALNLDKFHQAVSSLPLVFDAYKMRFELNEASPLCYYDAGYIRVDLPEIDFSSQGDPEAKAKHWMQERFNIPFLIEKQRLLFEHCLIKTASDKYCFFCRYHHLITDGYGFIVFVNYIAAKYKSLVSGDNVDFIYPSYREQAIKGYEYKNSESYRSEGKYWLAKIAGKPQQFLHRKHELSGTDGKKSSTHVIKLNREERALLDNLQQLTKSGLQQLTIAALLIYFGKTSNQSELIFGIPVHKRGSKQLRTVMGMFSGILPFKTIYEKDLKLIDVLNDITQSQKRDYRHHNYTIGDLSRTLRINASEGYLCDVMINYEVLKFEADFDEKIQATILQLKSEYQKNPLQLSWLDYGKDQPLEFHIHYRNDYFSKDEIASLAQRVIFIFRQFTDGLEKNIGNVNLVPLNEKLLLDQFSNTFVQFSKDKSINDLFEEQAVKTPDNIALVFEQLELSYEDISQRSNQVAHYLTSIGVKEETLVPICMERCPEMIIAILGILKAGGAYVPIDPAYPEERINYIIADTGAAILLCTSQTRRALKSNPKITILSLDGEWSAMTGYGVNNPGILVRPSNLAYIIYTSGSTGTPKGVMIEHKSLVNLILVQSRHFNITGDDRILQFSSYCFDASVEQIFLALCNGASLVLFKEGLQFDPDRFKNFLREQKITHLHATPLFLETLVEVDYPDLKRVIAGGDLCKKELANNWNDKVEFINEYGPTETTITAVEYKYNSHDHEKLNNVPIGKPLPNVQAYILDKEGSLCPLGVPGELCISGIQVARGYLHLPELTAEKFVPAPFIKEPDARMYKTGDRAKWLTDGNIEYLGRKDDQVKVRGYRIEPGETESILLQSDLVEQAVVLARKNKEGNNQLVGYIVPRSGYNKEALQALLRNKLPLYMIPDFWVTFERLPFNSNGKIDKNALVTLDISGSANEGYVAPGNELEAAMVVIWEDILNIGTVGIHDNFFQLGGHSLKAIQLISRLQRQFHIRTDIKKIFSNPTIKELCRVLPFESQDHFKAIKRLPEQDNYEISHAQQRIWVLSHYKDGSKAYSIPKAYTLQGSLQVTHLKKAFDSVIERHEILRTVFITVNDEPRQKILPVSMLGFIMEETDLRKHSNADAIIREALQHESDRTFDLTKGPLFKASLFRETDEKYVLICNIHHIISDGWSKGILIKEIFYLYDSYNFGIGSKLAPLPIQYKDYAAWQAPYSAGQGSYWRELFKEHIPVLNFPPDFERPKTITFTGAVLHASLDESLTQHLHNLASQHNMTLNSLLLSLYGMWVARYCNQNEVVIGSLTSGRNHIDLENLVGVFINYLPIMLTFKWTERLSEYLKFSDNTMSDAYAHQDYPFDLMVNDCIEQRDISHNPFFDTMVNFHWENDVKDGNKQAASMLPASGLEIRPLQFSEDDPYHSVLDFMLDIEPAEGRLECYLSYNANLFSRKRMDDFLEKFIKLLAKVAEEPDKHLDEYFAKKDEQHKIPDELAQSASSTTQISINICASFVAEPLLEYLEYWSNEFGLNISASFAPYNQVFQQLLNPDSMLNKNDGLNVLFVRADDWLRGKTDLPAYGQTDLLNQTFVEFEKAIDYCRSITNAPFLFGVVPLPQNHSFKVEVAARISEMNLKLTSFLQEKPGFYYMDIAEIASLYLVEELFDRKADELGHIPFTQECYAALGTFLSRKIRAYTGNSYKVLAVDCDNTLWKGVCGEVGATRVIIDENYAYLQQFLLEKHAQGFLLVLCSKNNEDDVWEVFDRHPDMLLKREHITAYSINWNAKHENLASIANELNVALDSFIFLDDSSFEVEQLAMLCPDVLSLALPEEPEDFFSFLNHIWALDIFQVTKEDLQRNTMYLTEKLRNEEKSKYFLLNDFLQSLNIRIYIRSLEEQDLQRAAQLSQRTNQFNLNGLRRSFEEIEKSIHEQHALNWIIDVKDRFGDYGTVGMLLAEKSGTALLITSFMLSCRVLGRNVEDHVLSELQSYCAKLSLKDIHAQFLATDKNKPFAAFLERTNWRKNPETATYSFLIKHSPQEIPVYE